MPPDTEYAVSVDYRSKNNHGVNAQLSIISRGTLTREQIIDAITERVRTGRNPKQIKIRFTEWRGKEVDDRSDLWSAFKNFADDAEKEPSSPRALDPGEVRDWETEGDDEE